MKQIILLISCFITIFSCRRPVNTTANCKKIDSFESKFGVLNLNSLLIGQIVVLDTVNKKATSVLYLEPILADFQPEIVNVKQSISVNRNFDFSFEAGAEKIFDLEVVKAKLANEINKESLLELHGSKVLNLNNPISFLNSTLKIKDFESLNSYGNSSVYFVVGGGIYSDSLKIKLSNGFSNQSNLDVKVGAVTYNISVKCDSNLDLVNSLAFYKPTFFSISPLNEAIPYRGNINLAEYNFNYTTR